MKNVFMDKSRLDNVIPVMESFTKSIFTFTQALLEGVKNTHFVEHVMVDNDAYQKLVKVFLEHDMEANDAYQKLVKELEPTIIHFSGHFRGHSSGHESGHSINHGDRNHKSVFPDFDPSTLWSFHHNLF